MEKSIQQYGDITQLELSLSEEKEYTQLWEQMNMDLQSTQPYKDQEFLYSDKQTIPF